MNSNFLPIKLAGSLNESSVCEAVLVVDIDQVEKSWDLGEVVEQMESQGVQRLILCDQGRNIWGLVTYENPLQILRNKLEAFLRLAERQLEKENKRHTL